MAAPDTKRTSQLSDEPPERSDAAIGYGSDAIAEQLSRLNMKYIALVPGSSYRGLHDSLVNFKGYASPEMLVCLHEEHAVAIAHGYAKVTGKPMAVGLHANVGLMHATMAIYNAFTDRVPMLILGATGPLDATRRRPWIDWLHTATDQAAMIRQFIKFDDQPHSPNAAIASLVQATAYTTSKPCAPVYICLDLALQEDEVDPATLYFPDTARYLGVHAPGPSLEDTKRIIGLLHSASGPLFMFGRMGQSQACWDERVKLAEKYGARVVTDLKQAASFPTEHHLHAAAPSIFNPPDTSEIIRSADLIISWDWVDLAGALQSAHGPGVEPSVKTTMVFLKADDLKELKQSDWPPKTEALKHAMSGIPEKSAGEDIFMGDLAHALYTVVPPNEICLVRVPLGWKGSDLRAANPLAFTGMDGGAGIGSGPGQVVGTALGLRETSSSLLPVAVIGDGDFCMGSSALWTAARYRLPLLAIVANNGSYYNDEVHQERVAKHRGRPVGNKWVGMRLDDPAPNIQKMAEGLGCTVVSEKQVAKASELLKCLEQAIEAVRAGKTVVLDVRVLPEGYSSALEKAK